jgi:hypothetical protein
MDIVIIIKKIGLAGLLFLLYSTFAIGQRQHCQPDRVNDGLQGKVKSIALKEYSATNDTDLLESNIRYYDEWGYLTEIKEFNGDGTIVQRQVFVYTKKRSRKEELLYDEDGNLFEKTMIKLNSMGNPTQSIVMDPQGNMQGKNTYQYDEKDRLVQQNGYDAKGKLSEKSYYTYTNDVLNQYLSFSEFENKKILYKYDVHKNPIEMLVYDSKTKDFLEKITQKFDQNKNVIETSYWDEKNGLKSTVLYKYDDKGNLLEYSVVDADKNIRDVFFFVYQYDKYNNWVWQTVYKGKDKQAESRIERIIEYYE